MTVRITPPPLGRAARALITATTMTALGVGLALGGAVAAHAENQTFHATAAQLEAACKKVGGRFVVHSGGASCYTKDGVGVCDPNGNCDFLANRPSRQSQPVPPITGTADGAGVA